MKPGFVDICAIICSLAMAVILAFDVVRAPVARAVQWSGRDAGVKSASVAPASSPQPKPSRRSVAPNDGVSRVGLPLTRL